MLIRFIKPISLSFLAEHHDKVKKCYINDLSWKKILLEKIQVVKHISHAYILISALLNFAFITWGVFESPSYFGERIFPIKWDQVTVCKSYTENRR